MVHEASDWRCVLPGKGLVHWRNPREAVCVDALTAFRLAPGDAYQLRHDVAREHHVLCSRVVQVAASGDRAWLVHPRELFQVMRAFAQVRRGDVEDLSGVGAAVQAALARAVPLRATRPHAALLLARQCVASTSQASMRVEEIAEASYCSPFHLTRLFRRHLGATPHQYRLHLRLAAALQRLADPGTVLADLAFELGFSSQSHFGESFRRVVGCTPGRARLALR